jgi:hypothetical protein
VKRCLNLTVRLGGFAVDARQVLPELVHQVECRVATLKHD